MAQQESWTLEELHKELQTWEDLLRARGYPDSTVKTYVGRSEIFLRWLAGDWQPTGPRA